jgi:ATP-dependent RNA helicase DDX3X
MKSGKYVPPALRKQQAEPQPPEPQQPEPTEPKEPAPPSKFARFISTAASGNKAETPWGSRDSRNGHLDAVKVEEDEELFRKHNSGGSFAALDDIPVEVSQELTPISSFEDLRMHPTLASNLQRLNYTQPSPVQRYVIGAVLADKDVMACAQTGSGKTAAYLLPICFKMIRDGPPRASKTRSARPVVLLLAPTRELAVQIYEESRKLVCSTGIRVTVVYGGADPKVQSWELNNGCDMLVGTPGRLLDFLNRGKISLSDIRYLVIDEADRMLDMGFEVQIRQILENEELQENIQSIMCSATFPPAIQALASNYMHSYVYLAVGRAGSTTEFIKQELHYVLDEDKYVMLHEIMQKMSGLVLIFVETKRDADYLFERLYQSGYSCNCIHGDREQAEREQALAAFKSGTRPILVATDVASRGLDIPNVTAVINYDPPNNIDDYVHRIGRTGRAGREGRAITFLNGKNQTLARDLYNVLVECNQEVPEWFERMQREGVVQSRKGRGRRDYHSRR